MKEDFGAFSRDVFSCKKMVGGRESASNGRLNESVDYIMLPKIFVHRLETCSSSNVEVTP